MLSRLMVYEPGSSPRLRGTLPSGCHGAHIVGIIPALAGNTGSVSMILSSVRDHPRACGEHIQGLINGIGDMGSSPRLRGTRNISIRVGCKSGIIPALAGNTLISAR